VNEFDQCQRAGFEEALRVSGEYREIVTLYGNASRNPRTLKVIWSTEVLKQYPVAAAEGGIYYEGDVLLTLRKEDLGALPFPGGKIESPSGASFNIIDVDEDFGVYSIKLAKNR
jgi:hypothetical protein